MSDPTTTSVPSETPAETTPAPRRYAKAAPKGVVATSELRAHTTAGPSDNPDDAPVGDGPPLGGSVDDGLVADHWHEPGNGPAWTPAGAHRHTPDGPVHVHLPAPPSDTRAESRPRPWDDTSNPAPTGPPTSGGWVADADFSAVVHHQLVSFRRGQPVGEHGAFLADTGAPVSQVDSAGIAE